jgi:hypothetical protein
MAYTRSNLKEFPNASPAFKRLNPHLFSVGAVEASQPECAPTQALERGSPKRQKSGAVVVRVSLVAHRLRLLDDDNNVGSLKPLRDAVAKTIGIDDGDARIAFECAQVETKGQEGVTVKIETV